MHLLVLVSLLLLYSDAASTPPHVYPHILVATDRECFTVADCLPANASWCQQSQTCVKQRCHVIPNYPCPYFQQCDARHQKCVPVHCSRHADCDDGLFCTGVESCVNSVCTSDYKHDCSGGHCDEKKRQCSLPLEVRRQRAHHATAKKTTTTPKSVAAERIGVWDVPTEAPTAAPTAATGLSDNAIIAIICASVVVAAVIFILLIIALISR